MPHTPFLHELMMYKPKCIWPVCSDVSVILETALEEIGLPVAGTTLLEELTIDQMSELASTITQVTGYLVEASDMEYCMSGLPRNLVTLIMGK